MVQTSEYKANGLGARHLQTLLLFLAIVVSYAERLNVSVSLVAMTDAETTNPDFHEFDWDEQQKSYIISSFYWGYFITQFPGGFMARKIGVKVSILIAILGSSLFNLLIPFCIPWGGWKMYCAIRIFQGLFQGFVFPSVHAHLAMWSPIEERNRLGGLSHTGIESGTILAMGLTGIIAASNFGWPGISYVYGGIGIVFCVIWIIFAENNPSDSRFISQEEKKYILGSQASVDGETKEAIPIPWKAILTSVPYFSLVVVRIAQAWGSTTIQTQIPAYLHGVLNMNIKSNALYSSLPYISQWILSFVFILVAEIVLKKKWASLTVVRKTWNTIAMWVPAALLVGVGFLNANQKTLAITLLTMSVGLNGGQTIGSLLNTIDLSPNHAAIQMGILNGIVNIIPIITPLAAGVIVYDETDRKLWQIIFIIAAVSFFLGNLQYIIFASTDTQPWNDEEFLVKQDCPTLGIRHLQTLLLFFAILVNYAGRLNISVSLVAMTNAETTNPNFHEFDWDEKQKSYIISSFYWGYFITQFPGGYMARKFGVKLTILTATLGSSLLNTIIPLCVPWGGWEIYCGIRIIQGLFQGMVFPCVHEHLAKWSPIEERTRLGGLSHTGIECGTIVAMGLSGIIAGSDLGWPGISYVFGGIGMIFCILWLIFTENTPSEARFITFDEKQYILNSQASAGNDSQHKIPIPWKAIFTSVPFLSLLSVRILQGWGFTTMQAQIPAYLHGVLKMDIKSNALYSTLPYLAMWILSNIYLIVADIILKNKWASLNMVRKTMNTIALWVPAALLIAIGFLDEDQKSLAVTFMILNVGLNGGQTIGSSLNTIDLSPNHAGILMGIVNSIANIVPILTPLAVGIIVYDETQRTQWQVVFIIAAVLFFLGNLQFLIFGTTNTQAWNDENFLKKQDVAQKEISATNKSSFKRTDLEVY